MVEAKTKRLSVAILPNWLGDLVMALPALEALRAEGPLYAVGLPPLVDLLQDGAIVDGAIVYDRHGRDRGPRGLFRAAACVRALRVQRAVVFPPSLRAAVLGWMTRAPRRTGQGGRLRSVLLTAQQRPARPRRSRHLADEWLALATDPHARVGEGSALPRFSPGPRGREGLARLRSKYPALGSPGTYVVLGAGATYGPTKRWPLESFARLARRITEELGWHVLLVGSGGEEGRVLEEMGRKVGATCVAGRTDLPTLAAVLQASRGFVGNDSGPMHLSAAVGAPTIGIFGSTSPDWTAPRGPCARTVGPAPVFCSPCFRRTCPYELQCLRGIPVDEVLDSLAALCRPSTAPER